MTDDLDLKIYNLLVEEAPGILTGDVDANARCCGALSENLGHLMADIIIERGQEFYEQARKIAFTKIDIAAEVEPGSRPSKPARH